MSYVCFIDLDGVMVDLDAGLLEQLNFKFPEERSDENKIIVDTMWDNLMDMRPTFWKDLKPMYGYLTLYDEIKTLHGAPIVLSATPTEYTGEKEEWCKRLKIEWVRRYLGEEQARRTIITKSKLKQNFICRANGTKSVLIDDFDSNITRWHEAGGIAIHHVGNESTIKELRKLKHDSN